MNKPALQPGDRITPTTARLLKVGDRLSTPCGKDYAVTAVAPKVVTITGINYLFWEFKQHDFYTYLGPTKPKKSARAKGRK